MLLALMSRQNKSNETKDKGWTDENVKIVKTIGEKRAAYVWLYNQTANYYENWNKVFVVVIAIAGYLFGTTGIPTLFVSDNINVINKLRWVNLGIQILVICVGVLATVHKLVDFPKKIGKARWASGKNAAIFREILKEVRKPTNERQTYHKFYAKVIDNEMDLNQESPFIPEKIVKRYYAKMGVRALKYEVLFSEQTEIETFKDPIGTASNETIEKAKKAERASRRELRESTAQSNSIDQVPTEPEKKPHSPQKLTWRQRYELEKYFLN